MGDRARGELSGESCRLILETAPDAMVIVRSDGTIAFVNAQTETLFGYARSDILDQRLDMLIPERFRRSHEGHVGRYFVRPSTRPMGSGLELFGRRSDGTEIVIEVSLSPVQTEDGLMVSAAIRDITERKRIEGAAKLNADRLASAVESIQDAFALFDSSDRLILCNSVYRRLVGAVVSGSLVGKSYESILDATIQELAFENEAELARFRDECRTARRDPKGAVEARTRDGRSLRITDRRTPEGGIVETIWDLTEDVHRERELGEARAAAEAGSAAKSEFLSSMSHELRTPMNAILGFAQLLQRDKKEPLSERHKERVDHILRGGEHLLRLIDDILDLSRIEAGRVAISPEPVSVEDVLDEVRRTLEPMATRQGISLEVEAPRAKLPLVDADRTRLVQILTNFGSNALKYNRPTGRVTFTVSTLRAHGLRVTVVDTGMGIATERQGKLFQPFQRAGQETGPIEGTGIGLVIAKRLAELMGGDVGFRSEAGQGSEFWVDIPLHVSGAGSNPLPAAPAMTGGALGAGRKLVLYVEDNPSSAIFMRHLVGTFDNLELVTTPTAEMGIEIARERHPDVIILDINLPGMSGLDALHLLRAAPETREIPVIALTAAASERDKERGIQAGFCRYLTKPIKVDEFVPTLEALLAELP